MGIFNRKNNKPLEEDFEFTIGDNRPFVVAEAHKRLRANVVFSFAEKGDSCRVIGVTSSMAHEGKSTTAVNLAYDMHQAGKKVLLIDADMRMSQVAKKLEINLSPGLSNILVGENNGENLIQHSKMVGNLSIISCGDLPPNPSELLSAKRMEVLLETLKKSYQYIIIDLPPVGAVSDALILSNHCDGMIIVARQDFVDKSALNDTIRQLKLNGSNIIGFVLTCATSSSKYYSKYKYKKYYGKKDGYYSEYYGYGQKNAEKAKKTAASDKKE